MLIFTLLRAARKKGYNTRSVIIIGTEVVTSVLVKKVNESKWMGYSIKEIFSYDVNRTNWDLDNYDIQQAPENIDQYVRENYIDEIWLALPFTAFEQIKSIFNSLRYSTVNIKLVPNIYDFEILNHSVTEISGIPAINLRESPISGENKYIKMVEDKVLSFLILVLISPIMLAIAVVIKCTSPGPVLFKQKRYGLDGREINVYKFRSMYVNFENSENITQAVKDDVRVTVVGKFIRRSSLDELPQLFNVIQGKMSLVGPRPHASFHNEHYKQLIPKYMLRHFVKPGITGWAQINGYRGETDTVEKMEKRIEYDLFYIENWSLGFDFKILWLTIYKGFFSKNAY